MIGAQKSGRSQLLRTLAGAVGARCSTSDVHLYGLDCGNGALLPLQDLPHCGAVVTRTQTERAVRLLDRLAREVERRQQVLAEGGFADISEQRRNSRPHDRLPHIVLLLDRWEGFLPTLGEVDGGRLTDVLLSVVREGASVGISAVITGDRSLGTSRLASLTDNKLVLRLADRGDYSLIGLSARAVPEPGAPRPRVLRGRGGRDAGRAAVRRRVGAGPGRGARRDREGGPRPRRARAADRPALPGRRPAVPALVRAGVGDAAG